MDAVIVVYCIVRELSSVSFFLYAINLGNKINTSKLLSIVNGLLKRKHLHRSPFFKHS